MKPERTASLTMIDTHRAAVMPKRVRAANHKFAPIADCEGTIFATLQAKENRAATPDDRKPRLPRFSLLRGEVALLAERVKLMGRQNA